MAFHEKAGRSQVDSSPGVCPVFCVNDQAFLVLLLLLGMGCKGRGQFPFLCVHVEKS
jgi:hypothetical protein